MAAMEVFGAVDLVEVDHSTAKEHADQMHIWRAVVAMVTNSIDVQFQAWFSSQALTTVKQDSHLCLFFSFLLPSP